MKLEEYLPFWDKLTGAQQRRLTGSAALRHFDRGAMVYGGGAECAGLILPVEGQLRAYLLTDEGRELTLYRLFPRDMCLFSASCVLRGIQFDVLVEAERDTVALFLPAQVYQGLMEESAAVANFTNELMADRFSEVMRRMDQLLSKKLDVRLAALLVEESRLAESSTLRLTHDRLARHLGSAREVVTRLLKDFQADGLVRLSRGGIELLDLPRLETLAAAVGEEAVTIEDIYEPYLMQIGFLSRTPRGRCVTPAGYEHLGLRPPAVQESSQQLSLLEEE